MINTSTKQISAVLYQPHIQESWTIKKHGTNLLNSNNATLTGKILRAECSYMGG
jgi:hypothetical protein